MTSDIILETLASIVGIISSFAMFPQVYRIFKRKSAKDISITTFSFLFIAGIIWILYGLNIQSFPIVISNLPGSIIILGRINKGPKSY
jgi:MtN3 and saliva related transmembrane protein